MNFKFNIHTVAALWHFVLEKWEFVGVQSIWRCKFVDNDIFHIIFYIECSEFLSVCFDLENCKTQINCQGTVHHC